MKKHKEVPDKNKRELRRRIMEKVGQDMFNGSHEPNEKHNGFTSNG